MVTVVIVFTICWLPFNILVVSIYWGDNFKFIQNLCLCFFFYFSHVQLLLNDQSFVAWEPVPYFWFAFHWLAMSHSCYNPVIYCYMNARFRGGFMQILHHVPFIRRCCCMRNCTRGRSGSFGANFALTGEFCARARFVIFLITF